MKQFKLLNLLTVFAFVILITSCDFSNPTYIEGGNADIQTNIITLRANDWKVNSKYNFQWYQEFFLTVSSISLSDNGVVIAYTLNDYDGWEAMPATAVFWDDKGIVYSTEFWYSYDKRGVYFDYRNTNPTNPTAPTNNIDVKLVIIDQYYLNKIKSEGTSINNYNELIAKVTADGGKINTSINSTK